MAPAFVQNVGTVESHASGTTVALTGLAGTVTAGNTLYVVLTTSGGSTATATLADNSTQAGAANVHTEDIKVSGNPGGAGNINLHVFRCPATRNILSTDTLTATLSAAATLKSMLAIEVSGVLAASPVDVTATNTGNTNTPNAGPTAATASATEFVLAAYGVNRYPRATYSDATSGYTAVAGAWTSVFGGPNREADLSYKITSSTGTQTDAATLSAISPWVGAILTYLPSSTSVTVTPTPGSATGSAATNAPRFDDPPSNALATASAPVIASVSAGAGVTAGSVTADSAGQGQSEALSQGTAGLATAGGVAPGFGGGSALNVGAPVGSATADAPVLIVSMATSGPFATATAGAPVPVVSLSNALTAGLATADGAAPGQSSAQRAGSAGLATASAASFPVPSVEPPGGGGYGAIMSDAFFQRYQPRYKPTLRRQKV
jgi:hypothetical protein